MVDLSTSYMGLPLKNPLILSASPLSRDLDAIQKAAAAGAGAIVLYSLFEEQIESEAEFLDEIIEGVKYRYAEMIEIFPPLETYRRDEQEYLELIRRAKAAVDIPIIPSLNGFSPGSWVRYAKAFEEAGADAVELNLYYLPTQPKLSGRAVEDLYVEVLRQVRDQVRIPVAMKLAPYFSSLPNLALLLADAGANGLVLFNRFYQPDLDIEALEVRPRLILSTSEELRLPLRWVALLYGRVEVSLALSTGVHTAEDAIKALMAGADAVQLCSVLFKEGVGKIDELLGAIRLWMETHEYASVAEMKGSLSQRTAPNPAAFERANYVRLVGGHRWPSR